MKYGKTKGQLSQLKEGGVDAVISSLPYTSELSLGGKGKGEGPNSLWRNGKRKSEREIKSRGLGEGYGYSAGQLGCMKEGDRP